MRILLIAAACLIAGWSAFWWIGSRAVERSTAAWLDARAEDNWVANYSGVRTIGFPNRFDTTISDLELADPETGVAWSAPFLQLLRLSYQPNHVIAVWPGTQTIASPHQRWTLGTENARASLVFVSRSDYELDRLTAVFDGVAVDSTAGWSAEIEQARLAARRSAVVPEGVDIAFELTDLRPEGVLLAKLAEAGLVPGAIGKLEADARLAFDAPWNRQAVEARRPAVTGLELNLLKMTWGRLELWMAGDLAVDAAGRASGEITVKARNWREMLRIGEEAGWIPESMAQAIESGLDLLARLSGSPRTLDAPLAFRDGEMFLGPVMLGEAPRLRIR